MSSCIEMQNTTLKIIFIKKKKKKQIKKQNSLYYEKSKCAINRIHLFLHKFSHLF